MSLQRSTCSLFEVCNCLGKLCFCPQLGALCGYQRRLALKNEENYGGSSLELALLAFILLLSRMAGHARSLQSIL